MEYPTIVFSEPNRITLAHELAHQWFYGTVGNDQYHEPWLDESFATWAMRLPFDPRNGCDGISWPSAQAALTNDMGYWAAHPGQYGLVYSGGACLLANLSKRFGHARFLRIIGRYAQRHRFDIARTEDFMAAIETAAAKHLPGLDVAAFWDRWRVNPS
jgi:aminopeptidase N